MAPGIGFTLFCGSVSATSVHLFKAIFYLRGCFMVWQTVLEKGQIAQLFV